MLKRNSINVHLLTRQPGLEIWCLSKVRTRPAGRIGDFGNFGSFSPGFSLKVHTYYPTYDIGQPLAELYEHWQYYAEFSS